MTSFSLIKGSLHRAAILFVGAACAGSVNAGEGGVAPIIIPQPKSIRMEAGAWRMSPNTEWVMTSGSRDEHLIEAAQRTFKNPNGKFHAGSNWNILQAGTVSHVEIPPSGALPQWASNPEGYRLVATSNGMSIISSSSQGIFYGLQTFDQLLNRATNGWNCPAVEIEDWPSMKFRGAHWFPSASGVPMHLKLIQNVFGRLKLNQAVIQCEAARWDRHPEIAGANSISKAQLGELVRGCRAVYLEPIPLVNTPGHAEWLFRHGNNLDLAEDPQTPYAYCVRNSKCYEYVEDVFSECMDVFHASSFHIGHDEVTMRGRFPNPECPRCKGASVTDLVAEHAQRLTEWFGNKNVRTMIWGDMLLGPGEAADATHAKTVEDARARRKRISKNTTIVDWHYAVKADARSLKVFQDDGFKVIAATFWSPENIYRFAQAALETRAEGLLQTTWMGYFPDERAMEKEMRQFSAFVLAADYAWSGRKEAPAQLGYEAESVFKKMYAGER